MGVAAQKTSKAAAMHYVKVEPILVDRQTAATMMLGIALSTFQRYIQAGLIPPPRKLGNRAGWLVSELQEAAARLPVSDLLPPPAGTET